MGILTTIGASKTMLLCLTYILAHDLIQCQLLFLGIFSVLFHPVLN